jgi:hypothetical protein
MTIIPRGRCFQTITSCLILAVTRAIVGTALIYVVVVQQINAEVALFLPFFLLWAMLHGFLGITSPFRLIYLRCMMTHAPITLYNNNPNNQMNRYLTVSISRCMFYSSGR